MDSLIKEDGDKADLCVVDGDVGKPSLSIVEKYDRFVQGDDSDEEEEDGDFLPINIMREAYKQIKHKSAEKSKSGRSRLSLGLPSRLRTQDANLSLPPAISDGIKNGTTESPSPAILGQDTKECKEEKSGVKTLNKLIEQLNIKRTCGPEGNSIFCSEEELRDIQDSYGKILDLLESKSATFEKNNNTDVNSPQESDHNMTYHETQLTLPSELTFDKKLLDAHLESTQRARDRFFLVEQQVRELVEQLELVERYKMESL